MNNFRLFRLFLLFIVPFIVYFFFTQKEGNLARTFETTGNERKEDDFFPVLLPPQLNVSLLYAPYVPKRSGEKWKPQPGVRSEFTAVTYFSRGGSELCPESLHEENGFGKTCNPASDSCGACVENAHDKYFLNITDDGRDIQRLIQAGLRVAWGPDPPQIDLYFRAGCGAIDEMNYLLPTIDMFWPEFLGEVIIVLDVGNNFSLPCFSPPLRTRQSYRFVYEDTPCMKGRIFNQVSYTYADTHSKAQFITTIDSDCAFHSPVTPDLLFDERGLLLLPVSSVFQANIWPSAVEFFTGLGTFTAHAMVTQPVTFERDVFPAYRNWVKARQNGTCFLGRVSQFANGDNWHDTYCWMCQLNTFLQLTHFSNKYNLVNLDDPTNMSVFQRFAVHTWTEPFGGFDNPGHASPSDSSRMIVRDGLCRFFGSHLLCQDAGQYISSVSWSYGGWHWPTHPDYLTHLNEYIARFTAALQLTP